MYKVLIVLMTITLLLSGCGTSSKADEFLNNTATTHPSIESNNTGSSSASDQLLEEISLSQETNITSSTETRQLNKYQNYSSIALDDARTANKTIVLVSFAEDCSNCKALENSINHSLSRIPDSTILLKVDYNNTELKNRYSITEANTIIVLNPDGTIKRRSSGGIYKIEKLLYYL